MAFTKRFKISSLAQLMVLLSILFVFIESIEPTNYTPAFNLKKHTDGKEYIFDREEPIAHVDRESISLRAMILRPSGKPLISECPMHWIFYCPMKLLDLKTEGDGTDCLVIHIRSIDQEKRFVDQRKLTVSYSRDLKSYVYQQDCNFTANPTGSPLIASVLEFSDPVFHGLMPGPSVPFPDAWKKKWQKYVYEADDGKVYLIPHNHNEGTPRFNVRLKRGGLIVAVYESELGNSAIEFIGDTVEQATIAMCHWGYDLHLGIQVSNNPKNIIQPGREYPASFRIFQCLDNKAKELAEKAVHRPNSNEDQARWHLPRLSYRNTFSDLLSIYDTSNDIDPWQWYPWHVKNWSAKSKRGLVLEKNFGRTDKHCLKIKTYKKEDIFWGAHSFGPSFMSGPWPKDGKVYRISGYIKTQNVSDGGSAQSLLNIMVPLPVLYLRPRGLLGLMIGQRYPLL